MSDTQDLNHTINTHLIDNEMPRFGHTIFPVDELPG